MKRLLFSLAWTFVQVTPLVLVASVYLDLPTREFWAIIAAGIWMALSSVWEERMKS